jgi:hypothetical protein
VSADIKRILEKSLSYFNLQYFQKAVLLRKEMQLKRYHCTVQKPVILATMEAEIRRISVRSQPKQILQETLSQTTFHKNRVGGVVQGEGPEFKPKYCKKKKKVLFY